MTDTKIKSVNRKPPFTREGVLKLLQENPEADFMDHFDFSLLSAAELRCLAAEARQSAVYWMLVEDRLTNLSGTHLDALETIQ
jgi:hypothetical protein